MNRLGAALLLLLVSFIWGGSFIATQIALDSQLTTLDILSTRFLMSSLILNIIFFRELKSVRREEIVAGTIIGIFLFVGFVFQIVGQRLTTPSVCAFVSALYVVMVPFFDWYTYKVPPKKTALLGVLIALIGVSLISVTDALTISFGVFLTLLAAISYTFQVGLLAKNAKIMNPVLIAIVMVNVNAVFATVGAGVSYGISGHLPVVSFNGVAAVVYLAVFCTAFNFVIQSIGQKYITATQAALIFSTESVFTVILSVLLLGEVLSIRMVIGCVLVLSAMIIPEINFREVIRNG